MILVAGADIVDGGCGFCGDDTNCCCNTLFTSDVDVFDVPALATAVGVRNIIVKGSTDVWECNNDKMTIHDPQNTKNTAVNATTGCFRLIHRFGGKS
jgi:hypothetical protein